MAPCLRDTGRRPSRRYVRRRESTHETWVAVRWTDRTSRPGSLAGGEHHLACVEGFRVSLRRIAFDAAQAHEAAEGLGSEPALAALGGEDLHEQFDLAGDIPGCHRHEHLRRTESAVELRNLVFEHGVIAERVPRQLADHAVILVQLFAAMREDHVGLEGLEFLEELLEADELGREICAAKILHDDVEASLAAAIQLCGPARLGVAPPFRAQYHPADARTRIQLQQFHDRATAAEDRKSTRRNSS